jgi:hypothetical protein
VTTFCLVAIVQQFAGKLFTPDMLFLATNLFGASIVPEGF